MFITSNFACFHMELEDIILYLGPELQDSMNLTYEKHLILSFLATLTHF